MKNLISKLNILGLLATLACGKEEEQDMTAPEGGSIIVEAVLNNRRHKHLGGEEKIILLCSLLQSD